MLKKVNILPAFNNDDVDDFDIISFVDTFEFNFGLDGGVLLYRRPSTTESNIDLRILSGSFR